MELNLVELARLLTLDVHEVLLSLLLRVASVPALFLVLLRVVLSSIIPRPFWIERANCVVCLAANCHKGHFLLGRTQRLNRLLGSTRLLLVLLCETRQVVPSGCLHFDTELLLSFRSRGVAGLRHCLARMSYLLIHTIDECCMLLLQRLLRLGLLLQVLNLIKVGGYLGLANLLSGLLWVIAPAEPFLAEVVEVGLLITTPL
mmetsp:Transcript_14011/g.19103  ORF Transcript_14011/g.19103 Transcript_14011/m.19103 type:complete len:202 (-) Transcript_14011:83-688(-)